MEYDDITLRPYLLALAARWRSLIIIPLLGAALLAALSLLLPKTYEATSSALVFIRQTGAQIGVGEPLLNIETIDIDARRQGLVAIANSDTVEAEIAPEVAAPLSMRSYMRGMLNKQVTATANGDLILFTATGRTPQQAKDLADTWAQAFVAYTKTKYVDQHSQIELASTAFLPFSPIGPRIGFYAVIGALLSLLLAITLILVQHTLKAYGSSTARVKGVPRPTKYPTT